MNIVLITVCLLAMHHQALALHCPTTPVYEQKQKKLCVGDDVKVLWPDYTDITQYYRCQGPESPVLERCFPNTVFNFYEQKCATCGKYVPAPKCENISQDNCEKFTPVTIKPTEKSYSFCNLPVYKTTFRPNCVGYDVNMFWPNYDELTTYYWCKGLYDPQIRNCSEGTYFDFYAQSCTDCESYLATPACEKLPFDKSNKCVKIGTLTPMSPVAPQTSSSSCLDLMKFSKKFTVTCEGRDMDMLWPNYENFSQYYLCLGAENAQLVDCPFNFYFSFRLQRCTRCNDFIPPPECNSLPTTSGKPTCTAIIATEAPPATRPPLCNGAYEAYYTTKYEPACVGKDVYRLWPNYENIQTYYLCDAEYNPVLKSCPQNTYFNYYAQECTPCDKFLVAPPCEKLKPQNTPKCVKF